MLGNPHYSLVMVLFFKVPYMGSKMWQPRCKIGSVPVSLQFITFYISFRSRWPRTFWWSVFAVYTLPNCIPYHKYLIYIGHKKQSNWNFSVLMRWKEQTQTLEFFLTVFSYKKYFSVFYTIWSLEEANHANIIWFISNFYLVKKIQYKSQIYET